MKIPLLLLALMLQAVQAGQTNTSTSVTLQWNPNVESNLAGYVVMYGTNSGFSTNGPVLYQSPQILATTLTLSNLAAGPIWFFAVKAVDTDGLYSEPSYEVNWNPARISRPDGLRRSIKVEVKVEVKLPVDQ
jgi:Fibronectin type III domain